MALDAHSKDTHLPDVIQKLNESLVSHWSSKSPSIDSLHGSPLDLTAELVRSSRSTVMTTLTSLDPGAMCCNEKVR